MRNKQGFIIRGNASHNTDVENFLKKIGVKCTINFNGQKEKWGAMRNTYKVILTNKARQQYSFIYYTSIKDTEDNIIPSIYDVLACVQKYEIDPDLQNFVDEFGYEIDSVKSYKEVKTIHKACIKEYEGMCKIFGDNLEELIEVAQ